MNLGTFLQTIITIVFIYLILALLASELQEYIAAIFMFRAKRLKESIVQMFAEEKQTVCQEIRDKTPEPTTLTAKLYSNSNIKALYQENILRLSGPSYIDSEIFATTIVSIIQELDILSLLKLKEEEDSKNLLLSSKKDSLNQKQILLIEEKEKNPVITLEVEKLEREISETMAGI